LYDTGKKQPTKAIILKELSIMLDKAKSGDKCIFTFSGHGSQIKDINNDENDGKDECLFTLDNKYITDDELKILINTKLKKGVKLFCLIDCCHSGTILDLKYNYKYTKEDKEFYENLKEIETTGDVCMLSGCMDSQVSMDSKLDGKYSGALTYSFLKNISNYKTWGSLLEAIRSTLILRNFDQIPQLSSGTKLSLTSDHYI
jgi:hypothetical protein